MRWYVHAGLRPGTDRGRDGRARLALDPWSFPGKASTISAATSVHGHTPQRNGRPDVQAHRTNLDTAAVYGGALTAGIFNDEAGPALGFLQVSG